MNIFKLFVSCFMMLVSLELNANTSITSEFTDDYDRYEVSEKYWKHIEELPNDIKSELLNGEAKIDVVIECYDKIGNQYMLSLSEKNEPVKNGGIDISRPMIIHYMVGDVELPVLYYKFYPGACSADANMYESNISEMTIFGKSFMSYKLFGCPKSFFFWMSPFGPPFEYSNRIGPFSNWRNMKDSENTQKKNGDNK